MPLEHEKSKKELQMCYMCVTASAQHLRVCMYGEVASPPCFQAERRPLAFLFRLNIWAVSAAMSADVAVCQCVLAD